MYDCWAIYDSVASTYLIGNEVNDFVCPFNGFNTSVDKEDALRETLSFACYRLLTQRFITSPGISLMFEKYTHVMDSLGYDTSNFDTNYSTGSPANLGNYIAFCYNLYGQQDFSNQANDYENLYYETANEPLIVDEQGNPDLLNPNRWQPLTLLEFIDQAGNPIPESTPDFLSPEWGKVKPFSLKASDLEIKTRDTTEWHVYHDPGPPPFLESDEYKWGFSMASVWSSHLDPENDLLWDISPKSIGNRIYPDDPKDFYNYLEGGTQSQGHAINPYTGEPYEENMVKRSDYARVLAEFWADGPDSETPPGHWYSIVHYVTDHPLFEKKFRGSGEILDDVEWDIKAAFIMAGAMHDAAVTAWGIKGYYDYIRPISAIRFLGAQGQSTDSNLPNYSPAGIPLVEDYIELVYLDDPLVGSVAENLHKIKIKSWRGPSYVENPDSVYAGVGWILAENWWPYQRPSFVTPPFAGYISGHSTFSRAAAEVLELLTGSEYFPGGLGEFFAEKDSFLVFEVGPTEDIVLQWATYRDAADESGLSRIWGGIHPPADDLPGRIIGETIGIEAFHFAEKYFFIDADNDGFFDFEDCDDADASINPSIPETCDGIDNDCSGIADDGIPTNRYYLDFDEDGFGDASIFVDTCVSIAPIGYVANDFDCSDNFSAINPDASEICDGIDNNCNFLIDEDLVLNRYYLDADGDGFGYPLVFIDTCISVAPSGYTIDDTDCSDDDPDINPGAIDIADNGIDENCDGVDFYEEKKIFPNPTNGITNIHLNTSAASNIEIMAFDGKLVFEQEAFFENNSLTIDLSAIPNGIYLMRISDNDENILYLERFFKIN